jgi:hypothetical protein
MEGRCKLRDLGVDRKIILKWTLNISDVRNDGLD